MRDDNAEMSVMYGSIKHMSFSLRFLLSKINANLMTFSVEHPVYSTLIVLIALVVSLKWIQSVVEFMARDKSFGKSADIKISKRINSPEKKITYYVLLIVVESGIQRFLWEFSWKELRWRFDVVLV